MKYKAHEYGAYATAFIEEHPIAAVFLQMGLGKTVITLTAILDLLFDMFVVRRILVIAPKRICTSVWPSELKKWDHLSILTYSLISGNAAARERAIRMRADIYIINRENIPWLCENHPEFFGDDLMIVIDELSSFKNTQSKRFKALMKQRAKIKRIVGLTGTPSSNGLIDLYGEIRLLDQGERLYRFKSQFLARYFKPDKMNGPIVYSYKPLPGAEEAIYRAIEDITISMTTDLIEMPELISTSVEVDMSDGEMKTYKQLKDELAIRMPDGDITAANAASLSNKLIQCANGAVYLDDGSVMRIHDRKLDALEDIIEGMNGNPLLVAYWYKHDLIRIKERLEKIKQPYEVLDGDDSIRRWNEGKIPVMLLQPSAGGHGLNLQQGGNTLVWFSLTWDLDLYLQARARLYRQGQQSATVVVMHIVTKGTIDERVMKALSEKESTQTALMDAVKAEIGG